MKKKKAIVLCSGGMDSCVMSGIANEKYDLAFLHLNYGQRTERRELSAFTDIANYYNVTEKLIINTSFLKQIGGSSLTDESIPIKNGNLNSGEIPQSYVPFRNANILAMAVSWSEVIVAEKIFIGAVEEDSSGYPDCRESFFEAFTKIIELGTRTNSHVTIETPLIQLSKADIVKKGVALNAPLHLSWSCYKNEDLACGQCDSCLLRLRGFKLANVADPIKYVN